jgi:CheY-like chemotaxis protein
MSLTEAGHLVQLCSNASDGIRDYEREAADIVITDIFIRENGRPVSDGGITVSHQVKMLAKQNNTTVGVIAISGAVTHLGMGNILETAKQVGADLVLAKPFAPYELLEAVDRLT